jgi:hypothetical protein
MRAVYELVPVIADVIAAHCPGTNARALFVRACVGASWENAGVLIEGMLAEPWHLRGYQEVRLREFLEMIEPHRGGTSKG